MKTRQKVKERIDRINCTLVKLNKLESKDSQLAQKYINDLFDLRDLLMDCLDEMPIYFEPPMTSEERHEIHL